MKKPKCTKMLALFASGLILFNCILDSIPILFPDIIYSAIYAIKCNTGYTGIKYCTLDFRSDLYSSLFGSMSFQCFHSHNIL